MTKKRVRLTVAYDGTDFRGWAAQTGRRTVQGTLTEAVRRVSGEDVEIVGASRTDSGAHALGQVCAFDSIVPPDRLKRALNDRLPIDLRVVESREIYPDFNARFWCQDRHYVYKIAGSDDDPFKNRFRYGQTYRLSEAAMSEAAQSLVGKHDFRAFTEELDPTILNTVRILYSVEVSRRKEEIRIDIVGTAFLRGMMRRIAGCLYEIGRGIRPVADAPRLLTQEGRTTIHLPVVLPAKGLTLVKVRYGRHPRDHRDQLHDNNDLASQGDAADRERNDE